MFLLDSDQKTSAKEPPNHQTLDTLKKERRRKALEKDQDNMTRMQSKLKGIKWTAK